MRNEEEPKAFLVSLAWGKWLGSCNKPVLLFCFSAIGLFAVAVVESLDPDKYGWAVDGPGWRRTC